MIDSPGEGKNDASPFTPSHRQERTQTNLDNTNTNTHSHTHTHTHTLTHSSFQESLKISTTTRAAEVFKQRYLSLYLSLRRVAERLGGERGAHTAVVQCIRDMNHVPVIDLSCSICEVDREYGINKPCKIMAYELK